VGSAYPKDTKDCKATPVFQISLSHIVRIYTKQPSQEVIPVYTNRSMWVQPILKTLKTARQHMFFKRRPPLQLKSVYHISCSSTQQPSQTVIPVYTHRSMWVQPILKTLKTARQQMFFIQKARTAGSVCSHIVCVHLLYLFPKLFQPFLLSRPSRLVVPHCCLFVFNAHNGTSKGRDGHTENHTPYNILGIHLF
jgi:predicted RNA-binding protein YlxR (DUF448 family)